MMELYDLHTHTVYCDGKNTPEEMILAAIEKGLAAIGFTGHAYTSVDESYCMSRETEKQYRAEILALREKYKDKICILCGIECDWFSDGDYTDFDYRIGSVHYIEADGEIIPVDEDPKILKKAVRKHFGGDWMSLCERYYETVSLIVQKTDCQIIGHLDLITKFNENGKLFSEKDPRYCAAVSRALDVLVPTGALFEINSGAMSRGYRTAPYPSETILCEIQKRGGSVLLSGDTHSAENLAYNFDNARKIAQKCGFFSVKTFTDVKK